MPFKTLITFVKDFYCTILEGIINNQYNGKNIIFRPDWTAEQCIIITLINLLP